MSIKQFFFTLALAFVSLPLSAHFFTVVLDPGTQQDTAITQETLTCMKMLQKSLEDTFPQARIVLSCSSQNTVDALQVASFSNRINANLHVSFNFFTESPLAVHQKESSKETIKNIRIYTCLTPVSAQKKSSELTFIPSEKAYELNAQESKNLGQKFFTAAKKSGEIPVFEPKQLPLKTLKTITAPSFLVEVGIGKAKEWKLYFPQLFEGLKEVVTPMIEKFKNNE
jgi:hypothetical protein